MLSMYSCNVVECVPGNFGPDCEWTCDSCQNGATCSRENPGCVCGPGWQGFLCNQTCPSVNRLYQVSCKSKQLIVTVMFRA